MSENADKNESKEDYAEYFLPGCLLLGIGVGFLYNNVPAGTLIGLGTGFLLMALSYALRNNKDAN